MKLLDEARWQLAKAEAELRATTDILAAAQKIVLGSITTAGSFALDDVAKARAERDCLRDALDKIAAQQPKTVSDYPYFSLSELQTMRGVFNSSLHYIGPVGLNAQATAQWRQHKHWLDRIDSLIAEYEECLATESEDSE